jgi:hypothetical protein
MKKILVLLAILVAFPNVSAADRQMVGEIFTDSQIRGDLNLNSEKGVTRRRYVNIAFDLLKGAFFTQTEKYSITLNLFPDIIFEAHIDRIEGNPSGSLSWIGKIPGISESEVILVVNNESMMGNIVLPGYIYQIRDTGKDIHVINEVNPQYFPQELPPIPIYSDPIFTLDELKDDGSTIDVLVAYTSEARSAAGGTSAMLNLIDLAISETNTGYSNSYVDQRVRLVQTVEVSYSEAGFDWYIALSRLKQTEDGHMDNLHDLRDQYSADMVLLIVEDYSYCGLAYLMTNVSTSFSSWAFSIVNRLCATGYYTFAHELGHNMGSHHNRANAGTQGAYPYSYGFQALDYSFRTIMAYNCPGGCSRVNYWSNPNLTYYGQPMGVVHTAVDAADNRRSLNNTAYTVSNFRESSETVTFSFVIESSSGGTTSPSPGIHTYDKGTLVTVTAIPDDNYIFDRWSGEVTGKGNPIIVRVRSNRYVKANFKKDTAEYTLNIVSGTGGTTDPAPGNYTYTAGTEVTITAKPETGYGFSSWSGSASEDINPLTITLDSDKTVTANFIKQYSLTITASQGGITDPSPGNLTYNEGTQVNITAIPESNYRFGEWSGDAAGTENRITVTMDSDKSVMASFVRLYTLTITVETGGSTDPLPGSHIYDEGTQLSIKATADNNYRFGEWSGDASGTDDSISIFMNSNKTISASFIRLYTLTIISGGNGTTDPTPGSHIYDEGTTVAVTATPNTHYTFTVWSGDASGISNPSTILMDSDKTITASFIRIVYPPLSFSGQQSLNRSLYLAEYINQLTWHANPDNENIVKYRIYLISETQNRNEVNPSRLNINRTSRRNRIIDRQTENRSFLVELDANTFEYWQRNVDNDKSYTYEIVAVNDEGREGDPAIIIIL